MTEKVALCVSQQYLRTGCAVLSCVLKYLFVSYWHYASIVSKTSLCSVVNQRVRIKYLWLRSHIHSLQMVADLNCQGCF